MADQKDVRELVQEFLGQQGPSVSRDDMLAFLRERGLSDVGDRMAVARWEFETEGADFGFITTLGLPASVYEATPEQFAALITYMGGRMGEYEQARGRFRAVQDQLKNALDETQARTLGELRSHSAFAGLVDDYAGADARLIELQREVTAINAYLPVDGD